MDESKLNRRRFLRLSATGGAAALLAACGSTGTGAPAGGATTAPAEATTAPTTAAAAPTGTTAMAEPTGTTAMAEPTATTAMAEPTTTVAAVVSPTTAAALPAPPAPGPLSAKDTGGMDALVAAAQKEGQLTVIALPDDWANYKEIKEAFKSKYKITLNDLNPDAGSGDEIEAIKANAGGSGPQAPDVVDVGFAFGTKAKADKLIQAYKVATWDTIPDNVKDGRRLLVRRLLRRALIRH